MKKKRGFKLKSGNNIVAKGKKPSNFKMMGASPAKAYGRFTTDDFGNPVQISDIDQLNLEKEQDKAKEATLEVPRQFSKYNPDHMSDATFRASPEGKKIIERLEAESDYQTYVPYQEDIKSGSKVKRIFTTGQEKLDELYKQYSDNEKLKRTGNMKGLMHEGFQASLDPEARAEIMQAYKERDEEKKSGVAAEQARLDAESRETDPAYLERQRKRSGTQMKKRGFKMKRKK